LGTQLAVLAFSHRAHRLAHVLHYVEPVVDDPVVRVGQVGAERVQVRLPHVHGDGPYPGQLLVAERLEVAVEARLRALLGDVLDRATLEVADEG
jgi:hypothetical protein